MRAKPNARARDLEPQSWLPNRMRAAAALSQSEIRRNAGNRLAQRRARLWRCAEGAETLSANRASEDFADAPGKGPLALKSQRSEPTAFS
jgi:hypothetical protein